MTTHPIWSDVARLFDAPACRAELLKANVSDWARAQTPHLTKSIKNGWPDGLLERQVVFSIDRPFNGTRYSSLVYTANYKVGSTSIDNSFLLDVRDERVRSCLGADEERLASIGTGATPRVLGIKRRWGAGLHDGVGGLPDWERNASHSWGKVALKDALVFTMVRAPVGHAIAAYLEVSGRWNSSGVAGEPTLGQWARMPCDSAERRRQRFAAYLEDVRQRRPLGNWFYHAYPQAIKIDAVNPAWRRGGRRYDAIGKVEDGVPGFLQQLVALLSGAPAPHPAAGPPDVDAMEMCFNKHHTWTMRHTQHGTNPCDVELSKELEREVCAIYAVDFACFGYELPASCL